jgi:hypothetical protein
MKTRELASFLQTLADFLASAPEFDTENCASILKGYKANSPNLYINYYDRDKFVAAVKALGSCTKRYTDGDYPKLEVTAKAFPIQLTISRDKVCKKTVVYDCEPLFSEEEVGSL